ncbi:MAG: hypothetical protein IKA74_07755 [Clostridia bacterium]|nr:hypothetical protein [Clostridia bacterium]
MIRRLMKYDVKKMLGFIPYIYAITLLLAVITRIINIGKDIQVFSIIGSVFSSLVYSAIASVLINTFITILAVFIKSFYKDESYLTHTLPVKKEQLLISKYLSALIVVLLSVAVCVASLLIMLYSDTFFSTVKALLAATIAGFNISGGLFITIIVLIVFFQICTLMSMAFTAVVKANTYNTKRVSRGVMWFIAYYFGAMITALLLMAVALAIGGNISELLAEQMSQGGFMTVMLVGMGAYAAFSVAFYFLCNHMFKKGVNVD